MQVLICINPRDRPLLTLPPKPAERAMRDVLVLTRECRLWRHHVKYAGHLAAMFDGSLCAVYNMPPPPAIPDDAPSGFAQDILDICHEESEAARHAKPRFEQWAREAGVRSCAWHVVEAPEPAVAQSAAKWNDILVLEQPGLRSEASTLGVLGRIVLDVEIPMIIVPPDAIAPVFDTIAVAWKYTPESIRALHAALPLLARARRIVLIGGERGTPETEIENSIRQAQDHLHSHGLQAAWQKIDPEPQHAGAAIFAAAEAESADLIVMGAYGRARFSEWMFGGATRHALQYATIPVFLRH
jgi:nucleotide-binding universal stress UspA family protein